MPVESAVDHSVRLEADPSGADVSFSVRMRAPGPAGQHFDMQLGDVTTLPLGSVTVERERDAAGRVASVRLVLDLVRLPDLPG